MATLPHITRFGLLEIDRVPFVIEAWRRHRNEIRPHSRLSYPRPVEFIAKRSERP
jgi:hypothetical protein